MLTLLLAATLALPGYRPPVDAPVVDGFSLPDGPYGAGNRGLDYATAPGTAVRAIGGGLVVFAGAVAGQRWVTVLHPDGLRSSYGPLARIEVDVGEHLLLGQTLGVAGERLHLGVRSGGTYLDPAVLLDTGRTHLVALDAPVAWGAPAREAAPLRPSVWAWLTGTLVRRP